MKTVKEIREAKGSFLGKVVRAVGSTAAKPVTAPIKVAKAVGNKVKYKDASGERDFNRFSKSGRTVAKGDKARDEIRKRAKVRDAQAAIDQNKKEKEAEEQPKPGSVTKGPSGGRFIAGKDGKATTVRAPDTIGQKAVKKVKSVMKKRSQDRLDQEKKRQKDALKRKQANIDRM